MIAHTKATLRALLQAGRRDLLKRYRRMLTPLAMFTPRVDDPQDHDEQTAFVNSKEKFSICLGGTGSGKTIAGAYKTARYLLNTKPYRYACPFWIVGKTFELCCAICWQEKLSQFIPEDRILSIAWHDRRRMWPAAVLLKHPDDPSRVGWIIEFKSYSQGRELMQGRSIGGFWFNEECPLDVVTETLGRTRDYDSPGWADFTPIESVMTEWPDLYDAPPPGWKFFHLNVDRNTVTPPGGTKPINEWAKDFLAGVPEDERETRRIGVFATFVGQVFKEFRRNVHVVANLPTRNGEPAKDWWKIRGVDFGYSTPHAVVWVAFDDKTGRYYVYDEHYEAQRLIGYHVAKMAGRWWDYGSPYCLQTYCDSSRPDLIQEMINLGVQGAGPAQLAKEPGAIARRISLLRSLMLPASDGKPRLYIHERCKNLIREIRAYHWQLPIGKDLRKHDAPKDIPVPYDDHAIDAMAYAIFSHAMGGGRGPRPIQRDWEPREGVQIRGIRR